MRRAIRFTLFCTFAAAAYVVAQREVPVDRLPIQAVMLDVIRCSPPTYPDTWMHRTVSDGREFRLGSRIHLADIYDPSDCGRSITQAFFPGLMPRNHSPSG